jgi:tetrahydromethanopterin S-methyltransferase subunit G
MPISLLGRDREHRDAAAVAIEQPVDEMKVAGSAASGTDGELARQVGLGAGSERRGLLIAHVDPADLAEAAKRVAEAIEAVANHAVNAFYADLSQRRGDKIGGSSCHGSISTFTRLAKLDF